MSADTMPLDGGDERLNGMREQTTLDTLGAVLRGWRTVLGCAVAALVAAVIVTLVTPSRYVTRTVLVPAAEPQSRNSMLLSQLPGGIGGLLGIGGANSSADRLIGALLKSRTLLDTIAAHVGRTTAEQREIRRLLDKKVRLQRSQDGTVTVDVTADDPQLAARIANAFPVMLNEAIARVSREAATRRRAFIQDQLRVAREDLVQSEERMLQFQQKRSTPDLPEQARRTIDAAAELQTEIYRAELEVAQLRRVATADNPDLRAAEATLAARREQLRRLASSQASANGVLIPMGQGAELRMAATRLLREYATDEKIYESLTAAQAEAQIAANDNMPVLSVLDPAEPPPGPTLPIVPLFVSPIFGLLLGCGLVVVRDAAQRMKAREEGAAFFDAWASFKRDVRRGGRRAPVRAEDA
jgi:uncharacterized protein involved in exopolysaccharide biosynthesis